MQTKVFEVKINGITENINATKALKEELKSLKEQANAINSISAQSGKRTTTSSRDSMAEALKLRAKNEQELIKNQQINTEEYKQQYQIQQEILRQRKEVLQIEKDIASGARDENGNYTNTINGLRAELKEMTSILNTTELTNEEFAKYQTRVGELNEQLKSLESAHGDFRRNVGNYPSGTAELTQLFKDYQEQIKKATEDIDAMKKAMEGMSGDELTRANQKLSELENKLAEAEKGAQGVNAELGKKISINVGGNIQYFDNLRQASRSLQNDLQRLYMENRVNTKEFEDTIQALGRVRTAMQNVSGETKSYIGGMKGLEDTITLFKGFTGLASIGTGIRGLFGSDEDNQKNLSTYMRISVVLQGISTIQKQINDSTDIFGVTLNKINNSLKNSWIATKLQGTFEKAMNYFARLSEDFKSLETLNNLDLNINLNDKWYKEAMGNIDEVIARFNSVGDSLTPDLKGWVEQLSKFRDMAADLNVDAKEFGKVWEETILKGNGVLLSHSGEDADNLESVLTVVNKVNDAVQNLGVNTSGVRKAIADKKTFAEAHSGWAKLYNVVNKFTGSAKVAYATTKLMASGLKLASLAFKGLALAIKEVLASTVILLAVQLIIEGIMKLIDALKDKTVDAGTLIDSAIERTNKLLERQLHLYNQLYKTGRIGLYEKQISELQAYEDALNKAAKAFYNFLKGSEKEKLDNNFNQASSWGSVSFSTPKNIEQFRTAYQILIEAVEEGTDKTKAAEEYLSRLGNTAGGVSEEIRGFIESWKGWEWWQTASDAQDDLADAQKAVILDLNRQLYMLDWNKPKEAVKKFRELIDDEMYSSALANLDGLDFAENWKKTFKATLDNFRDFADRYQDILDEMAQSEYEVRKKIEDNNVSAISNSYQRAKEQRRLNREREMKEAEGNAELQASIKKKYDAEDARAERDHSSQIRQIQLDAQNNYISTMKDGLDKRLAEIENARQKELESARQNENATGSYINSIEAKYNKQRLVAIKQFNKDYEKATRDRIKAIEDLEYSFLSELNENERQIADMLSEIADIQLETGEGKAIGALRYDDDLESMRKFYDEILKIQEDYAKKRAEKLKNETQSEYDSSVVNENNEFDRRKKELESNLKDMIQQWDDYYEEGKVSESEYNEEISRIKGAYDNQLQMIELEHQSKIEEMAELHGQRLVKITEDTNREISNINATSLENYVSTLSSAYSKLENKLSLGSDRNVSKTTGIIDYNAERENLKSFISRADELMDSLTARKIQLGTDFSQNKITFEDFKKGEEAIDELASEIALSSDEIKERLNNLFQDTAVSIANAVSEYASEIGNAWNAFNELRNLQFDALEEEIDREADMLDKEADMMQEKYDKQADIVQEYTDRINDIEDELSEARGDRRQALIDNLAAQRQAQLEALSEQTKIAEEQKRIEKQQEANKAKADKLEKERKKQDQKDSIIQAIISTAAGVANALAVKPAWAGIALAATIGALGAAQVATISSQKYADGGIIQGKSHAQGGVKVLGGYAEVEGGEYITNRSTTSKNRDLLNYINSQDRKITLGDMNDFFSGRKFAEGGQLPNIINSGGNTVYMQDDRPIFVSVSEIDRVSSHIRNVKAVAGI